MFTGRRAIVCGGLVVGLILSASNVATAATAEVVRVTRLSRWRAPSPDPTGLSFDERTGRLLISDAEVDESVVWRRRNLYVSRRTGGLIAARKLASITREPEDVAWNGRKHVLYVVDDDAKAVYAVRSGRDRVLGTNDDTSRILLHTRRFGSRDPEGLAWRGDRKSLIVTDASNCRVYVIGRGRDRRFDTSDDRVRSFGTARFGFSETEDVWFDVPTRHLFIVSSRVPEGPDFAVETTYAGKLLRKIAFSVPIKASGVVMAPATDGTGRHLYVTDSGSPEDVVPKENDGRLYEFAIVG